MTSPTDLIDGFHRFREAHFAHDDALYRQLVKEGQTPKILVVACCDSRVDPALVLDCEPGDLFVIRNVANLVPPAESRTGGRHGTSAALEYGVCTLKVEHIIVLGHAHCGGIRSLFTPQPQIQNDNFINSWMRLASHAKDHVLNTMQGSAPADIERACEQQAILGSLENLMTFPWIQERVDAGKLRLHGWYFDIEHGQLMRFDSTIKQFTAL